MQERGIRSQQRMAFITVTILFFAWGFITSLIDPLVAAVKGIFSLTDVMAQLSASAFFIAYGLVSVPASLLVARRGSSTSILLALALMMGGCLIMLLAANLAVYVLVLAGLFALAGGITILQVTANPLAASLGDPARSHFRLTLSQTFNSVGTFVGPFIGAVLFLEGLDVKDGALVSAETRSNALLGIDQAYFWLAGLIGALACYFWFFRKLIDSVEPEAAPATGLAVILRDGLGSRWTRIGAVAIFLYVGAEVSIGTMLALFLHSDAIWGSADAPRVFAPLASFMQLDATPGVSLLEAAKAVSLYWGGAMAGRLIGTYLLTRLPAALLLCVCSVSAAILCFFVFTVAGPASGFAALSIGLFNSLMFPTIFSLSLERSNTRPEVTSGVLCTAIIGGAVTPLIAGWVSDRWTYSTAFVVPMICYLAVAVFAVLAFRTSPTSVAAASNRH